MATIYSLGAGQVLPDAGKTDLAADINDATTTVGAAVAGVATGGTVDLTGYATVTYVDAAETDAVTTANTYTDQQIASIPAPDLTGYVTDSDLTTALSSKADTADVPTVPPVASIPFVVKWNGTAWPYATLADAQAAGLDTTQTVWFIGNTGGAMPTWARDGDVWTQG